ncbi:MAG TPA: HAMP domain-containing sensor histidine kinase [Kofleriaceae bacterium]|jgi:signal transduction histidine kinase
MPPVRTRSLASRLVLVGVIQLALIAAAAIGIFVVEGPHGDPRAEDIVDPHRLEMLATNGEALAMELEQLREQRIEISLYDGKRQLLATNVDPPLAIPARWGHFGREGFGWGGPGSPPPGDPPERPPADPDAKAGDPHVDESPRPPPPEPRMGPRTDDQPGMRPRGDGPRPSRFGPKRDKTMLIPFHPGGEREDRGVLVARGVAQNRPPWFGPLVTMLSGFLILVVGAVLTARWIVRPIDRVSRTARALGAGQLSARTKLDRSDEIGELSDRVDEMADRIQDFMRSEKELFANIAHELRTPLTRIGVALDLAGEGDASAARASLAEIAVDVSELETIIDDILATLRFEIAGREGGVAQLPLRRSQVAAGSIAEAAAERLRSRHPSRPFEVSIANDLPHVDVDQILVRRVLDNLLENSHKYSPDPDAKITLDARRDGKRVRYEVKDHGIGIVADDLPRVFTPFFRSERSRTRQADAGGVGLGLTLAKRIVDAHEGTIDVTSTPGVGTTVVVTLPVANV